jgi:hypothetical protein
MDVKAICDALTSHAEASGYFDSVLGHEPKGAPQGRLTYATWGQEIGPAVGFSGLNASAAFLLWYARLYTSMLQEPQDQIDIDMALAGTAMIAAYSADFRLGDEASYVDLLGTTGTVLRGRFGYQEIDKKLFRVFTIEIPVVVDAAWSQTP